MERNNKDIAKVVREANRSEIHRNTDITLSHVSRVLSGQRTASSRVLSLIAPELGVTMDELYQYLRGLRHMFKANLKATRRRKTAAA